jgi:CheY-like chemotaxis protein
MIYALAGPMMRKILLVDNNREYRQRMAMIVRRVGYEVIQADEVTEAMERSSSDRPDLIMMELTLPAMNGVEIAAWLKTNLFPSEIPVVIYTAQQAGSWIEGLGSAAAEVLTKPISSADVGEVLRKHLPTSRNRPRPIASASFDSSP